MILGNVEDIREPHGAKKELHIPSWDVGGSRVKPKHPILHVKNGGPFLELLNVP